MGRVVLLGGGFGHNFGLGDRWGFPFLCSGDFVVDKECVWMDCLFIYF